MKPSKMHIPTKLYGLNHGIHLWNIDVLYSFLNGANSPRSW